MVGFGSRKRCLPSREPSAGGAKKSKAARMEEAAEVPVDERRTAKKGMTEEDLVCNEVVEGLKGKKHVDLACYETLDPKTVPCRFIKISSRRNGEEKDGEISPSPVDSTSVSGQSWWQDMDGAKRTLSMQDPSPRPMASNPRSELEYHKIQAMYAQTASNRRAPGSSSGGISNKVRLSDGAREVQMREYPIDWSIKTSAKIQCKRPFNFGSMLPSTTIESRALLSFVKQNSDSETDPQALYRSALLQWRHPAQNIPAPLIGPFAKYLSATGTSKGQDEWATTRLVEWEDAFHSLYQMLRQQECAYFYYIGPIFTVLFIAGLEGGLPCAYLTNSTKALRKKIDAENIEYTMPLAPNGGGIVAGEERISERDELRKLKASTDLNLRETTGLGFVDGGADSMLSFQGHEDVHGLFDFLQSRPHDKDVPQLLSPSPFLHASLKQLRVKDSRSLQGAAGSVPGSEVFTLEVEGIIMPCALRKLLTALSEQQGSFTATLKTDSRTVSLNVDGSSPLGSDGQRAVVYSARCMDGGSYMISASANG